jgi:hypothetical protein
MQDMKMNTLRLDNLKEQIDFERQCWEHIDKIRWYFLSKYYGKEANDLVAKYCIENLTLEEIPKLHNFIVNKRENISNFLNGYLKGMAKDANKLTLSDDGFWDLCSHIVGLGEVMYEYVKTNPDVIFHLQKFKQENFEYGFDRAIYELNEIKEIKDNDVCNNTYCDETIEI